MSDRFVAYYRVSTRRQSDSGLGLDAQRSAVAGYVGDRDILDEFTEVESGRKSDRPQLKKAIAAAKKHRATLIIAKLDRLSRNVRFVAELMESQIEFVAVDAPYANKFYIHILAALAEHERENTIERTKNALAAAKARGMKLGASNPRIQPAASYGRLKGQISIQRNAMTHAHDLMPIISGIKGAGVTTLTGIAEALNARGIKTARGKEWRAQTVANILKRSKAA
jgi:DNA invertase Pin-like site-specific DNA recombinase